MKLSFNWICDHLIEKKTLLPANAEQVTRIVQRLGESTTEIEQVEQIQIDLNLFTLAQLQNITNTAHSLRSTELNKEITVEPRKDGVVECWYLLYKDNRTYRYATVQDIRGAHEGLIPNLWCKDSLEYAGDWKKNILENDFIITLDNKAITHRPDLWGHRGFAREIAALMNMHLQTEENISVLIPIKHHEKNYSFHEPLHYTMAIETTTCKRLAGALVENIPNLPSLPHMAFRLAAIDSRPINLLVDTTNYVMFDIGQPMHAFDALQLEGQTLESRNGRPGETITLLDGATINLTAQDCVIADSQKPLALAGIMGSKNGSVTAKTHTLLVESANFDATAIRLSSARHKHRTEASSRFEKSLDPHQNTFALLRFFYLLNFYEIPYQQPKSIISLGKLAQDHTIEVAHAYLIDRIGMNISSETIISHLTKIGFGVQAITIDNALCYKVLIPTFRSTKDVLRAEDLIEEIARLVGYKNIPQHLPSTLMKPIDHTNVLKTRSIKQHCAFALKMHEVSNYPLYDEHFLYQIKYTPSATVTVKNPISENWIQMVTSLIPHLFKNVLSNIPAYEHIRFFEMNNSWNLAGNTPDEQKMLSGIFFTSKEEIDFYTGKEYLQSLFDLLKIPIIWQKKTPTTSEPWYLDGQTASLWCNDTMIGTAGKVSPLFLHTHTDGDAFIFEINADMLLAYTPPQTVYAPISKYQTVHLDISMLIPASLTVDRLQECIAHADARIIALDLRDFFEKPEWKDQRSVTFRFTIGDEHKTLTKDDIDEVWNSVTAQVTKLGAIVR